MIKPAMLALFLLFSQLLSAVTTLPDTVKTDIHLQDTVYLDSSTMVINGATITVAPGTELIALSVYGGILVVDGAIICEGTYEKPIRFSHTPVIDSYTGILIDTRKTVLPKESRFYYCDISGMVGGVALFGVESKSTHASFKQCRFTRNQFASIQGDNVNVTIDSCYFGIGGADAMTTGTIASITGTNSFFTLTNSVFENCRVGAVKLQKGGITLRSSTFENSANLTLGSAGVYTAQATKPVEIAGCTFRNMHFMGEGIGSGAINIFAPEVHVRIDSTSFENCTGVQTGAVLCEYAKNLSLKNVQFLNNSSTRDGGALTIQSCEKVALSNCRFDGNSAAQNGGALYLQSGSNIELDSLTFENNNSIAKGGAFYVDQSKPQVTRSQFSKNSSGKGGALFMGLSKGVVTNSRFTQNKNALYTDISYGSTFENLLVVDDSSYALGIDISSDTTRVVNCTFANNHGDLLVGLSAKLRVVNSIFSGSEKGYLTTPHGFPEGFSTDKCWGTISSELDPKFANSDAGNFYLAKNSPCIDAGDSRYITTSLDIRGAQRVIGSSVDIGAFEYDGETNVTRSIHREPTVAIIAVGNVIQVTGIEEGTVVLYSLSGREVWRSNSVSSLTRVDLPTLIGNGTYLALVKGEWLQGTQKIQISR